MNLQHVINVLYTRIYALFSTSGPRVRVTKKRDEDGASMNKYNDEFSENNRARVLLYKGAYTRV